MDQQALRRAIDAELEENLLPFWRERVLDEVRGGFIAEMANDGTLRDNAAKGLILNARLLWTFSTLFTERREPEDLALACRAYDFIDTHLRDRENGGYFWRVAPDGRKLDGSKKTYGQAFVIYALCAYAAATGDAEAADRALELFELIESHAHDDEHGGYIEARAEDWSAASELRLSAKDMEAAKSMNTHLHLLEAYTGFYRVWPDERVAHRLRELLDLFGKRILDRQKYHLRHFFDQKWGVLSDLYTYGHDIEAAWLLCEAAQVLGESERLAATGAWALSIARAVLPEAIDAEGGLAYEGRNGVVINPNREWWCQAEAVIGFWQAYQLSADGEFAAAAIGIWKFITRQVVDRTNGEWFWRILPDGTADADEPKVSEWKGPYHNIRMCLEILRRISQGEETGRS
jgi:mannobiose 2-epimerase